MGSGRGKAKRVSSIIPPVSTSPTSKTVDDAPIAFADLSTDVYNGDGFHELLRDLYGKDYQKLTFRLVEVSTSMFSKWCEGEEVGMVLNYSTDKGGSRAWHDIVRSITNKIDSYAALIHAGETPPPVIIDFPTPHTFALIDGWHRVTAAYKVGLPSMPAYVVIPESRPNQKSLQRRRARSRLNWRGGEITVANKQAE
jgi:hypothetical protein